MSIPLQNPDELVNAEAWDPANAILGPGKHDCVAKLLAEGNNSKGNPEVQLQWTALDGTGGTRDWIVVLPQTYGKVKALYEAIGQVENMVVDGALNTGVIDGKRATITVIEKPDRQDPSKKRTEVTGYESLAGGTDVPADTAGLAYGSATQQDDDIPF